jgi:DNA-binding MarR family transcriptional regulator
MNRRLTAMLKERGIRVTPEQWAVLSAIMGSRGDTQTRIADRGLKDRANVTRILDVLECAGLISRRADAADRRAYRIFLTEKGESTVGRIVPIVNALNLEMARGMTAQETAVLGRLLAAVERNLS